jgi:hypothetical protein
MARRSKFGVWQPQKKQAGGGHAWGLASPGSGEARRKVHLQSQPCLSERANKSGGEEKMEKVVIQGLANPESKDVRLQLKSYARPCLKSNV